METNTTGVSHVADQLDIKWQSVIWNTEDEHIWSTGNFYQQGALQLCPQEMYGGN